MVDRVTELRRAIDVALSAMAHCNYGFAHDKLEQALRDDGKLREQAVVPVEDTTTVVRPDGSFKGPKPLTFREDLG